MPQVVSIPGCGPMVCSDYEEMAAAIDSLYAVAEDQPLATDRALGALAAEANREGAVRPATGSKEPEPG